MLWKIISKAVNHWLNMAYIVTAGMAGLGRGATRRGEVAGRCDGTTKWDCLAGLPQPTTSAGQAMPIHDSADKVRGSSDTFMA